MVASQHTLRIGLLPSVASSTHWSYSKPCAAVPAAWLFYYSQSYKSKLLTPVRNKKARTVRAGFVTPSGFKPETF